MNLNRIKRLREENELTQKSISTAIGVNRSAYSLWEIGKNIIPLQSLNSLCNYYGVSMDYIIGKSNNLNCKNLIIKSQLNKKEIGIKLKQIRKENNYTQEKLASLLNTTHSAISAYENGITMIPTIFLIAIVNKFNVSMDWICGRIK